jgi:hypothetical protein
LSGFVTGSSLSADGRWSRTSRRYLDRLPD